MTTPSTPFRKDHTGNGTTGPFLYDWQIESDTHLSVTKQVIATGIETPLVLGDDYTVTGVGNPSGGNVNLVVSLPNTAKITILPNVPFEQDTDFTNQNSVKPEVAEAMADKLSRQIKQLNEKVSRAVTLPPTSTDSPENYISTMNQILADTEEARDNAQGSETAAAGSASSAAGSASAAATSASNAATSATNAGNSATAAAGSASTASTAATNAGNSATAAAGSATTASTQAGNASTSATNASNSATAAATSAGNASTSEANALASANAAATLYDNFDDRYLGAKASNPTVDNDGNALIVGALYFSTSLNAMRYWNGTTWASITAFSGNASDVAYSNTNSELAATNAQTAIDELASGTEYIASANTGTSYAINYAAARNFLLTLTGNCTFTFTNPPSTSGGFTLILKQDATGGRTVTWPASVKWPYGAAPTLTGTANSVDAFVFMTPDGGTTWYGFQAGGAMA